MSSIKDVAKQAGVSIATVSRYFRGTAKVLPETAEKIRLATADLKYTPDFFASSLKSSHSNQICFMISNIRNLFFNYMAESLERAIQPYAYQLILALTYNNSDILQKQIQNSLSLKVSAFVYVPSSSMAKYYTEIHKNTYALQLFMDIDSKIDSVMVDDTYGTELAVSYFIEKGYTDVVMLDMANENFFKHRTTGFISAYEKKGLTPPLENLCVVDELTLDQTIDNIFNQHAHPTILAVTSEIATAVIKHVYERNLKFKKDVSLIVYDDMEIAEIMNITCISHDKQKLTEGIIETLMEGIKHQADKDRPVQKKVFMPFLLERDSV